MKIARDTVRDGVLLAGLGCTGAGAGLLWGAAVALLVIGVVLTSAAFVSAFADRPRGTPKP